MDFKDFFPQDLHKDLVDGFQKKKKNTVSVSGVGNNTSKVFFLSNLVNSFNNKKNIFWVTQNKEQALEIYKLLQNFTLIPTSLFLPTSEENKLEPINKIETISYLIDNKPKPRREKKDILTSRKEQEELLANKMIM